MSTETMYLRGVFVAVLIGAGVAAWLGFVEVSLQKLETGEIGTLLLTAIFVALVIERAVEVYCNNRFEPERAKIRLNLSAWERNLAFKEKALQTELALIPPDQARAQQLRDQIAKTQADVIAETEKIEPDLAEVRRRKAAFAATLSTVLGVAAAIVGVRVLGQFLPMDDGVIGGELGRMLSSTDEAIKRSAEFQLGALRFVDVVVTTGLLAGGADGIHQIIKRFTQYRAGF